MELVDISPALDWSPAGVTSSRAQIKQTGLDCFETDLETEIVTREASVHGPVGPIPVHVKSVGPEHSVGPIAIFIHGGGWISGDLESSAPVVDRLVSMSRATIINVGYSLSPEVQFPVALHECKCVVEWALAQYGRPIAVIGDSAGGNLAASLCLEARDSGIPIEAQVLICPVIDPTNESYESRRSFGGGDYLLTNKEMRQMVSHYVSCDEHLQDPLFAPMLASSLAGLPPALVITAEFDMLVDEGRLYADRLVSFGVPVDYRMFEGTLHDFAVFGDALPLSYDALGIVATYIAATG